MSSIILSVLKDPRTLYANDDPEQVARVVPTLLAVGMAGAAVFGAVIGSYRGGVQVLFAGAKMPILLLVPLFVCLPAIRQLFAAFQVETSYRRLALAGAVGFARTGILAAALAPVVWLPYSLGLDYHAAVLVLAGSLVLVAMPGLTQILGAVPSGQGRWIAAGLGLVLLGMTSAQTGWLLRPFVARPTAEVAFLRPIEADVASALLHTGLSSTGVYAGWDAQPSGLIGDGLEYRRPGTDEIYGESR